MRAHLGRGPHENSLKPAADDRLDLAAELDPVVALLRAAGCVRAEDEAAALLVAAHSPAELEAFVARRVAGEPLEHVVGWADFAGVRVHVGPGVFVPRHRSEHLVAVAAELLAARRPKPSPATPNSAPLDRGEPARPGQIAPPTDHRNPDHSASHRRVASGMRSDLRGQRADGGAEGGNRLPVVLDLCAGTGALGLALHRRSGPFHLVAADLDPAAVACAAQNLAPIHGVAVVSDLFDRIPDELRGNVDLIPANAPYVPTAELDLMPHEAREHEPPLALDGGPDGLTVHRRLIAEAPSWLAQEGAVLIEVADRQVPAALDLITAAQLKPEARPAPDDPGTVTIVGWRRA